MLKVFGRLFCMFVHRLVRGHGVQNRVTSCGVNCLHQHSRCGRGFSMILINSGKIIQRAIVVLPVKKVLQVLLALVTIKSIMLTEFSQQGYHGRPPLPVRSW